jgi:hypothetical protein
VGEAASGADHLADAHAAEAFGLDHLVLTHQMTATDGDRNSW